MSHTYYQTQIAMRVDAMDIVTLCGQPRCRSPQTTNKDRILADLLADVEDGILTVHEAAAAYGRQPCGAGRPRRFPTFASYLVECIRYAEDPAIERRLRELLARTGQRRPKGRAATETRGINRLLARTGSARAERLRELLDELAEAAIGA